MQENIPIEEVFENLRCTREGLSAEDANRRLEIFGHNKLEEKEVSFCIFMLFSRFNSTLLFLLVMYFSCFFGAEKIWIIAGEQDSEVFGVYVEPFVMGDGSCGNYGHCSR